MCKAWVTPAQRELWTCLVLDYSADGEEKLVKFVESGGSQRGLRTRELVLYGLAGNQDLSQAISSCSGVKILVLHWDSMNDVGGTMDITQLQRVELAGRFICMEFAFSELITDRGLNFRTHRT